MFLDHIHLKWSGSLKVKDVQSVWRVWRVIITVTINVKYRNAKEPLGDLICFQTSCIKQESQPSWDPWQNIHEIFTRESLCTNIEEFILKAKSHFNCFKPASEEVMTTSHGWGMSSSAFSLALITVWTPILLYNTWDLFHMHFPVNFKISALYTPPFLISCFLRVLPRQ